MLMWLAAGCFMFALFLAALYMPERRPVTAGETGRAIDAAVMDSQHPATKEDILELELRITRHLHTALIAQGAVVVAAIGVIATLLH